MFVGAVNSRLICVSPGEADMTVGAPGGTIEAAEKFEFGTSCVPMGMLISLGVNTYAVDIGVIVLAANLDTYSA